MPTRGVGVVLMGFPNSVLFDGSRDANMHSDTGINFQIEINNHPVYVKAFFLSPEIFGTVPMFFLSTDLPENDYLAQTTSHTLYDSDPAGKVAQSILLGVGGAKLLELLYLKISLEMVRVFCRF